MKLVYHKYKLNLLSSLDQHVMTLDRKEQLHSLSQSFASVTKRWDLSVPDGFCEHALKAMTVLKESRRSNVLYHLARALSTSRTNGFGSKFPTDRMPMEYMVRCFDFSTAPQVCS